MYYQVTFFPDLPGLGTRATLKSGTSKEPASDADSKKKKPVVQVSPNLLSVRKSNQVVIWLGAWTQAKPR